MKKYKKVDEASFKSFNDIDLSKIPGSVTEIFTTNFERFNSCRTYNDVVALCHQLLDDAKLDTGWTRKFFYNLEKIREHAPTPRAAYEQAMLYVNNARMKGLGLGMDRGGSRHRFYEEENANEVLNEGWIGGILGWITGGVVSALLGAGLIPALALVGIGAYGGHKIQKYFENKHALKNLDDGQIALLTALAQTKGNGLSKDDIKKICDASKEDFNEQVKTLDALVDMGAATSKGSKYLITQNGRNILKDAGFNQSAFDKDIDDLQKKIDEKCLDESMDSTQKEEFKKKLRGGEVKFSYKKKDGSVRDARGTMKPELMDLPEKKSQPEVDTAEKKNVRKLPEDSVFYYDLDKKGFRSFKMENFVEYK